MSQPIREPNGRWRAVVRTAVGRGAPRLSRTFDTKAEATRWQTEMRAQVQRGTYIDVRGSDELLSTYAERWLEGLRCAPGTKDVYRSAWHRLEDLLGPYRLDQLRRPHLERTLLELKGAKTGKPLADSTRHLTHVVLAMILKDAVARGQLAHNPLAGLRLPTPQRREVVALDKDQLTSLLTHSDGMTRRILTVAVGTGMRQGELLGLARSRVDFLRRFVSIEQQVTSGPGRPPAVTPILKTPSSRRRLPVPAAVTQALAEILEERPDADLFFLTPRTGKMYGRNHFNDQIWKPALKRANLPKTHGFHVMRHTYASHLIAAGVHPRVIMARMGHASIVETMDTYGHLFPDGDDETRQALEALISGFLPAASTGNFLANDGGAS